MIDAASFAALVVMTALYGGKPDVNAGQTDVGFMWYRFPNGMCFRVDTGHAKDLPKNETWMDAYEYSEMARLYFVDKGWIVTVDPTHPMCVAKRWTSTQGLYQLTAIPPPPTPVTPPPVVPPPPVVVTLITAPLGSIVNGTDTWTFGTSTSTGGNALVLNGTPTSGFGNKLQLSAGKVYTLTLQNTWFVWNGAWTSSVAPQ